MPDNIIIRKANESDLEQMLALIRTPEADDGIAMETHDANSVLQFILDDANYFQIIASSEQGIIAMATLVIIVQLTHEGTTTAIIKDLIISQKHLQQGEQSDVTKDLLQYCSDLAQEYGCYKTIFDSHYQPELTEAACQALNFEKHQYFYLNY